MAEMNLLGMTTGRDVPLRTTLIQGESGVSTVIVSWMRMGCVRSVTRYIWSALPVEQVCLRMRHVAKTVDGQRRERND